jgi:ketosteroid isomerase-like protein
MPDDAIWTFLHRHLESIFSRDSETYKETTAEDLSLYEWFVTPHRQDGLDFHFFMIDNAWTGEADAMRYDLLEPRLQRYGDTAIVSYTFMVTMSKDGAITHRTHNESRVLVKFEDGWKVVHVHKSPAKPTASH